MSARLAGAVLAATLVALGSGPARADTAAELPRAEVWTMGRGDEVFTKFGHAALCIYFEAFPEGRCYNYGTGDFDTPFRLIAEFLRGRAIFWVSMSTPERTLRSYRRQDRTVYRQRLPLTPPQARALVERLQFDELPENSRYRYHHFLDNCTTRVRDHVDVVTGGALSTGAEARFGPTWRELVREGFQDDLGLIMLTEVLVGRSADAGPSLWQAMFLPDVLRAEVRARFGAEPEVLYERRAPLAAGHPAHGRQAVALIGLILSATAGLLVASGRRGLRRVGLVLTGLVLGCAALVVWALAASTTVAELRVNEVLLVLLPTDLVLVGLGGRWLRRYVAARLVGIGLVFGLVLAGILVQPLGPVVVLAGVPFVMIAVGVRNG